MASTMQRDEAIQLLCSVALSRLTREQRADQLETMLLEGWDSYPRWSSLPAEVQEEFAQRREREELTIKDPGARRYDPALMLALAYRYEGVRNEFLLARLRESGHDVREIDGAPALLHACPCCGYRTLEALADYDICLVCWWEDDGQDNENASTVRGGVNYDLSLTRARVNFLSEGISDPSREDLRRLQEPCDKYERGRTFELWPDRRGVREPTAGWSAWLDVELP